MVYLLQIYVKHRLLWPSCHEKSSPLYLTDVGDKRAARIARWPVVLTSPIRPIIGGKKKSGVSEAQTTSPYLCTITLLHTTFSFPSLYLIYLLLCCRSPHPILSAHSDRSSPSNHILELGGTADTLRGSTLNLSTTKESVRKSSIIRHTARDNTRRPRCAVHSP